jgi:hypothetical protein
MTRKELAGMKLDVVVGGAMPTAVRLKVRTAVESMQDVP